MSADCLFCKIVAGTIPAKVLFEDGWCVAFPDVHPQAPVHVLVVPKDNLVSLAASDREHTALLGRLMSEAAEVARMQGLEKGYRVVINTGSDGGQTVGHLHLHVLGGRHMGWPPG